MPILQIGEFSGINVDDSFLQLSPDEQQQTVNNIHQQLLAGQTSSDQVIDAPPEQPSEEGFFSQLKGSFVSTLTEGNPKLGARAIEGLGRAFGSDFYEGLGC